jgi:hypothetical protein
VDWQPREPPLVAVSESLVLDRWRPSDGPALRRLDLDPGTAPFSGYSVEQAAALPDSHYDGGTRAQANLRAWREGRPPGEWREKCGFSFVGQHGDEYKFERELNP